MRHWRMMWILVVVALIVPGLALAQTKVIKYAHFQPAKLDQPKQAAALAFKNYVEANSKGSLKVEVYPASQLGNDSATMEGLKMGTIEMAVVHDGPISAVYKPFMVYAIPYLFDDQTMAWTVVDGPFGKEMAEDMTKKTGIRLFALADNGIRHFTNSKRPIKSPDDMKGLKMRVMTGPIWTKLVEPLGASPSPVPWTELPAALQQGVHDERPLLQLPDPRAAEDRAEGRGHRQGDPPGNDGCPGPERPRDSGDARHGGYGPVARAGGGLPQQVAAAGQGMGGGADRQGVGGQAVRPGRQLPEGQIEAISSISDGSGFWPGREDSRGGAAP